MNCFREYVRYIKDNPEGYWFKRKLYGYGWTPARREGWLVLLGYLVFVLGLVILQAPNTSDEDVISNIVIPVAIATILLVVISWKKGEPLKWQWGKSRDSQ